MPITIQTEKVVQSIPVTINTPHYYRQDFERDDGSHSSTIFGKITEDYIITIHETVREAGRETSYTVERTEHPNFNHYKEYLLNSKYASKKEEFERALLDMKEFLGKITVN